MSCWCCGNILVSSQEVAGWQGGPGWPFYCNDKYFVTEFSEFSENIKGKLKCVNSDFLYCDGLFSSAYFGFTMFNSKQECILVG